jgi:hypothetical protein
MTLFFFENWCKHNRGAWRDRHFGGRNIIADEEHQRTAGRNGDKHQWNEHTTRQQPRTFLVVLLSFFLAFFQKKIPFFVFLFVFRPFFNNNLVLPVDPAT